EVLLREYLAYGECKVTPEIEAVLAMFSLRSHEIKRYRKLKIKKLWLETASIAASLALVISIAVHFTARQNNICEMYIAGVECSDHDIIMQNIENDLALMSRITSANDNIVADQLLEFINNTNSISDK
ncbi:MAG: hypothetical protein K2J74_03635, partial [Muribaculaceae bacterium]|nr:hypothetical protein [Muribaculaceae bacterium]